MLCRIYVCLWAGIATVERILFSAHFKSTRADTDERKDFQSVSSTCSHLDLTWNCSKNLLRHWHSLCVACILPTFLPKFVMKRYQISIGVKLLLAHLSRTLVSISDWSRSHNLDAKCILFSRQKKYSCLFVVVLNSTVAKTTEDGNMSMYLMTTLCR